MGAQQPGDLPLDAGPVPANQTDSRAAERYGICSRGTRKPMPRSLWNGTVTFGMVNIPIKLYTATESKTVHFHEVHQKDGARIQHRRICPKDEQEVPADQTVKGYEVEPDKYVHSSPRSPVSDLTVAFT